MRLVLDTNILIAALIKDSITRRILLLPDMEFLLPDFASTRDPVYCLGLAEKHDGIWSNDRAFENLPSIQLWTTTSLKTHLRL